MITFRARAAATGLLAAAILAAAPQFAAAQEPAAHVETLVLVRHAETGVEAPGMLSCQGLNRALMLPDYFARRLPPADHIVAPGAPVVGRAGEAQPQLALLTLAPTAVRQGLAIDTGLAFDDADALAGALLEPRYHGTTIYLGGERERLRSLAQSLLRRLGDPTPVPAWREGDYDSVYVLDISWGSPPAVTFEVRAQNLGAIREKCPTVTPAVQREPKAAKITWSSGQDQPIR